MTRSGVAQGRRRPRRRGCRGRGPGEEEAGGEEVDALGDALGLVGAAVEEARGGGVEDGEGYGEDEEDGGDAEDEEHPLEAEVARDRGGQAENQHDLTDYDEE